MASIADAVPAEDPRDSDDDEVAEEADVASADASAPAKKKKKNKKKKAASAPVEGWLMGRTKLALLLPLCQILRFCHQVIS